MLAPLRSPYVMSKFDISFLEDIRSLELDKKADPRIMSLTRGLLGISVPCLSILDADTGVLMSSPSKISNFLVLASCVSLPW
uniref:Uncharacterized protein n=1 Tax=Arundo donax TaxID=35708 RepID=A0A0A9A9R6_ARUDO